MRRTRVLSTFLALALAACGAGAEESTPPSSTTTVATTTTTTIAGDAVAPLTGLPGWSSTLDRPALIVKIDNAPKGRPQAGLNQADVVVEQEVEGGVTRFAAIFHSTDAEVVGPIRSARSTDVLLASALNRPLFAYSGANAAFLRMIRRAPVVDVGIDRVQRAYHRAPDRPATYDLMSGTAALFDARGGGKSSDARKGGKTPPPMFRYRSEGQAPAGEPAARLVLDYRDRVRTAVAWTWDARAGVWERSQNGTPHLDADGEPVTAANVVVQFVRYTDTGQRDRAGYAVPEADLVGSGTAWLLSEGRVVEGTWTKRSATALTEYTAADGSPMLLTPGRTWLELPRRGKAHLG